MEILYSIGQFMLSVLIALLSFFIVLGDIIGSMML
jgi:hypothetical protein